MVKSNWERTRAESDRKWRRENPKAVVRYQNKYNWKRYGIKNDSGNTFTLVDYDRMYQVQQGRCAICKKHQTSLRKAMGVDHDHKTGTARGLLCDSCNARIGVLENIQFIRAAKKYLGGK